MTPAELKAAMQNNVFGNYQGGVSPDAMPVAQPKPVEQQPVAPQAGAPVEGDATMQDLWTQKYGNGSVNGNPNVAGVKNDFGHEVFDLPQNMPITIDDSFDGPRYNEDIGEVLGFDPDGKIMTTKTHPYLRGLVRGGMGSSAYNGAGGSSGPGGMGGNGVGGGESE